MCSERVRLTLVTDPINQIVVCYTLDNSLQSFGDKKLVWYQLMHFFKANLVTFDFFYTIRELDVTLGADHI